MIFVTVGTPDFDFSRLVKKMDQLALKTDEEIVIQKGKTKVETNNCESHAFIPEQRYEHLMKHARIVVVHAGVGSILTCFNYDKKPVVVPRRKKFKEHKDDHQIEIAKKFADNHGLILIDDIDELDAVINEKDESKFKFSKTRDKEIVKKLKEYLETLAE